ncbi:MAG: SIR2 family protein, partial [Archangium sp.]
DELLTEALREAGKKPRVEFCRWKADLADTEMYPLLGETEPDYQPDSRNPLVYHLFGRHKIPESRVLTQDDYLDFLIGYTKNDKLVPSVVKAKLSKSALLFIGFQLEELRFRVLFRSIFAQEGSSSLRNYAHIAAQVDPESGRIQEPEGARKYLESYFLETKVNIYWGETSDFMEELLTQWRKPAS